MNISKLLIISLSFNLIGFSNSFTEIKSSIKAYDFSDASIQIENYLSSDITPIDPEIYLLKFINEIGKAIENDTPDYLVNNFNASDIRAAQAFDISGDGVNLTEIPLIIDSQIVGYWYNEDSGKFPIEMWGDEYENELNSIFDWRIESEIKQPFSFNAIDGPFYYGNNQEQAISFVFNPTNNDSDYVDFMIEVSDAGYANLEIYHNGQSIGRVSSSGFNFWEKAWKLYSYNDGMTSNDIIQLPLYLNPGDIISFQYRSYYDTDSSYKIGVMPFDPYSFGPPENGKSYNNSIPDVGDDITIGNVLSFLIKGDGPARSLLKSLISELDNFITAIDSSSDSYAILGHSFTGFNSNILVQKPDAIAIKSILEIIDVFGSIINQYDLSINIDDSILDDGDEMYNTAKEFLDTYTQVLSHKNTPENIDDQLNAQSQINSALTAIEDILQTLWYRGSPDYPTDSYLIETSSSSDSSELFETEQQLIALKNSINGFERISSITNDSDGGSSVSFAPFFNSNSPLNIRLLASELSDSTDADIYNTLNTYGFIKDYLPINFDGKILVFYNSNGQINSTIVLNQGDDYSVDPLDGELSIGNFSRYGNSTINFDNLDISYLSNTSGEWHSSGYYNYNTGNQLGPIGGTFYFYDSLLDLNQNGKPDIIDLYNSSSNSDEMYNDFIYPAINYQSNLDSSFIDGIQSTRYPTPQSLRGYINLEEDEEEIYNYSNGYYENQLVIEAGYFISNNDRIDIDIDEMSQIRTLDIETYEIDGDIITFTETIPDGASDRLDQDSEQLFFTDQYSYIKIDIDDSSDYNYDMDEDVDIDSGVIYPAYLDLDNDGLADGEGLKAQIAPVFDRLPTSLEIQAAVDLYNQNNAAVDDESSQSSQGDENPNSLTDADNDNMPDALELQYGGNPTDPNDATITLNQILSVDRYTLNEITDLRLGSTLYEITQGVASFNIILEESPDMVNWVQHEPMQVNLGQQPDDNSKFYRFKMSD